MIRIHSILSDPKKHHDLIVVYIGPKTNRMKIYFSFEQPLAFKVNNEQVVFNKYRLKSLGSSIEYHKSIIKAGRPFDPERSIDEKSFYKLYNQKLIEHLMSVSSNIAISQLLPQKQQQKELIDETI